jgi:hypothetical protein
MKTIDLSIHKPWRDQRDNTWRPHGSCNVTSYVMAGENAGVGMPGDENLFLSFMSRPRWYVEIRRRFNWAYETNDKGEITYLYPPEQIHDLLAQGFDDWTGNSKSTFNTCWTRRELICAILAGAGVVLSGKFPYKGGRSIRHIVCLSGFETLQDDIRDCPEGAVDPERVRAWILDDPYGDFRTEYEVKDGNGVRLPVAAFNQFVKGNGPDCKWAHVLEAI